MGAPAGAAAGGKRAAAAAGEAAAALAAAAGAALLENAGLRERVQLSEAEAQRAAECGRQLAARLEQQQADQADIFFHLHKNLDARTDEVAALDKERERLRGELAAQREALSRRAEAAEARERARAEAAARREAELTGELASLSEFSRQKAAHTARVAELDAQLAADRKRHEEELSLLEMRLVQEKERLKKDMLVKIRQTKVHVLAMTENQLDRTTRRTALENEQIATELEYQSHATEALIKRVSALETENAALKRDMELAKAENLASARKANVYWNLSQTLHKDKEQYSAERAALLEQQHQHQHRQQQQFERDYEAGQEQEEPQRLAGSRSAKAEAAALLEQVGILREELATARGFTQSVRSIIEAALSQHQTAAAAAAGPLSPAKGMPSPLKVVFSAGPARVAEQAELLTAVLYSIEAEENRIKTAAAARTNCAAATMPRATRIKLGFGAAREQRHGGDNQQADERAAPAPIAAAPAGKAQAQAREPSQAVGPRARTVLAATRAARPARGAAAGAPVMTPVRPWGAGTAAAPSSR